MGGSRGFVWFVVVRSVLVRVGEVPCVRRERRHLACAQFLDNVVMQVAQARGICGLGRAWCVGSS